jgi:type IV secretion system protein VirB3
MTMDNRAEYPSYNALARVAMLKGVPLVAAIGIALASLVIGAAGAILLGPGGMLLGAVGLPLFFYCKGVSENDDQALRIAVLEFRCWLARRNARLFGGTYTLAPIRYRRREHAYISYFKKRAGADD